MVNIALRRFLHNHGNIVKESPQPGDYAILLFRMTLRDLYSAQYHSQHCIPQVFEQFGVLYMHNHDDKYPFRYKNINVLVASFRFI